MQRPPDKLSVPQQCGEFVLCWWLGACVRMRACFQRVCIAHTCMPPAASRALQRAPGTRTVSAAASNALRLPATPRPPLLTHTTRSHTTAITATGLIWTRYSTQITPVNYNLMAVNALMACTGTYQLYRKLM
jgi:hypothetical protein